MEEHRVNFVTVDDKQDWRPLFDGYKSKRHFTLAIVGH